MIMTFDCNVTVYTVLILGSQEDGCTEAQHHDDDAVDGQRQATEFTEPL